MGSYIMNLKSKDISNWELWAKFNDTIEYITRYKIDKIFFDKILRPYNKISQEIRRNITQR